MKHNVKVTITLITMFIVTQLIGLFVLYSYNFTPDVELPYGMQPPEEVDPQCPINSFSDLFVCAEWIIPLIIAFVNFIPQFS